MSAAEQKNPTSVVVIGMGAAGMAAAITAHDAGARVTVIEKTAPEHAGGNSRVSGQVWFSPIDAGAAERHLRAMSHDYPVDESVVAAWAEETAGNTGWVEARLDEVRGLVPRDLGDPYPATDGSVDYIEYGTLRAYRGEENPPRYEYHEVDGNECGTGYYMIGGSMGFSRLWLTLKTCCDQRGIRVLYSTTVTNLVRGLTGQVEGVEVQDAGGATSIIQASGGVILATGGFAGSKEMTQNYLRLPDATPWGSPYNTGDGIRLAQKAGADLRHPYNYMASFGVKMDPYPTGEEVTPKGNGYIHVGVDGRRFIDESVGTRHGKTRMRGEFDFHPGTPMWTVFDQTALDAGPLVLPRDKFPVGWMKQIERYEWSADSGPEIDRGWIKRADSIKELALLLGIDPDGLEAQIDAYNSWVEAGADDPSHGRPAATMAPIASGPFYGYEWGQLLITTLGGIRKDGRSRVLDPDGSPIEGLFTAGDTSSTYSWALSGGMGLGDALAFGRIAGAQAAARANGILQA